MKFDVIGVFQEKLNEFIVTNGRVPFAVSMSRDAFSWMIRVLEEERALTGRSLLDVSTMLYHLDGGAVLIMIDEACDDFTFDVE